MDEYRARAQHIIGHMEEITPRDGRFLVHMYDLGVWRPTSAAERRAFYSLQMGLYGSLSIHCPYCRTHYETQARGITCPNCGASLED